jgi:hypothetical protein
MTQQTECIFTGISVLDDEPLGFEEGAQRLALSHVIFDE